MAVAAGKAIGMDEVLKQSKQDEKTILADKQVDLAAAPASSAAPSSAGARDGLIVAFANGTKKERGLENSQRFVQVQPVRKAKTAFSEKASPVKPVLVSFAMEHNGQEVRIVDSDGSVYSGYAQTGETTPPLRSATTERKPTTRALRGAELPQQSPVTLGTSLAVGQSFFFRVIGTNRSLNEKVVFTGNVIALTSSNLSASMTHSASGTAEKSGLQVPPAEQTPGVLQNARITGKALVGDRKEIEINAVTEKP